MKNIIFFILSMALFSGCVAKKKFRAIESDLQSTSSKLTKVEIELVNCLEEKKKNAEEIDHLRKMNEKLTLNLGELTLLTKKEAENLQQSLQKIQEKDLKIYTLQDALTRKD